MPEARPLPCSRSRSSSVWKRSRYGSRRGKQIFSPPRRREPSSGARRAPRHRRGWQLLRAGATVVLGAMAKAVGRGSLVFPSIRMHGKLGARGEFLLPCSGPTPAPGCAATSRRPGSPGWSATLRRTRVRCRGTRRTRPSGHRPSARLRIGGGGLQRVQRFVVDGGLVAFHDDGRFPGVTAFVDDLLATGAYASVQRIETLFVVRKTGSLALPASWTRRGPERRPPGGIARGGPRRGRHCWPWRRRERWLPAAPAPSSKLGAQDHWGPCARRRRRRCGPPRPDSLRAPRTMLLDASGGLCLLVVGGPRP